MVVSSKENPPSVPVTILLVIALVTPLLEVSFVPSKDANDELVSSIVESSVLE